MNKIQIIVALIIFCVAPSIAMKINGGEVPVWLSGLAIAGLVIGVMMFFLPTRKDLNL